MNEESQEEKIQKILKETEKIKQENQNLREEINKIKNQQTTQKKTENLHNEDISRREFLKKAGIGTLGLGALLSPVYGLEVRSDNFNILTSDGGGLAEGLEIDGSQNVTVPNGNLGIGIDNPSLPLEISGSEGVKIPVGNDSQRSDSPKEGEFRINSERETIEVYHSDKWRSAGKLFYPVDATGGDEVFEFTDPNNDVDYRVHVFSTTGESSFEVVDKGSEGMVEVLVVGGGGGTYVDGGSGAATGGGGAGGLKYDSLYSISEDSFTVTVGEGGITSTNHAEIKGEQSSFADIVAEGGGGSARSGDISWSQQYADGGSGAGEGIWGDDPDESDSGNEGDGISGKGNNGATGKIISSSIADAGGGGGAGSPGGREGGHNKASDAGEGLYFGDKFSDNLGDNGWFASGGAGGNSDQDKNRDPGLTKEGGGGSAMPPENGQPNTGGGAGGAGTNVEDGAEGGSGIVIIRYPLEKP